MSLVFLGLAIAVLWANLMGAGLVARRWVPDYAMARSLGVLAPCLAGLCIEHFVGFGPHLPVAPVITAASLWLIWRNRGVVRENLLAELFFAAGFFYCLLWRYSFPDIDFSEDKMPNFGLIESYMRGTRLPAPDLWLYPFPSNCYYSFRHYGAALLGRILGVGPGVSYHLGFCVLVGFLVMLSGTAASRLCGWRTGRLLTVLGLMIGGSGVPLFVHFLVKEPSTIDIVRFLGGAIVHNVLSPLGHTVSAMMASPGVTPRDLPMEPLSYFITKGDFHPPLAGFVILAMASALIVLQETGASGRTRSLYYGLLAATVPLVLISNAWVLPLQCLFVGGWFLFRILRGERDLWKPALVGASLVTAAEYPFLLQFTQQAIGDNAAIRMTASVDHTPWLGWVLTFWPAVGVLALCPLDRKRRPFAVFLVAVWAIALGFTEFFYNHDIYGDAWSRFNSTLKWWQWVYAGIMMTAGALNLGSDSRLCRYGTVVLFVATLAFGLDIRRQYVQTPKASAGHLSGARWIERDDVVRDMIVELKGRPDGVTLESGLQMANSESPAVSLFSDKQSLLGWPWLEEAWRGSYLEINQRLEQMNAFYSGKLDDPTGWLLHNNVTYILWLPRDNKDGNAHFAEIRESIRGRYYWHHTYGNDRDFAVGFWQRLDSPSASPTP
jgi:uncharacterized membrane protein